MWHYTDFLWDKYLKCFSSFREILRNELKAGMSTRHLITSNEGKNSKEYVAKVRRICGLIFCHQMSTRVTRHLCMVTKCNPAFIKKQIKDQLNTLSTKSELSYQNQPLLHNRIQEHGVLLEALFSHCRDHYCEGARGSHSYQQCAVRNCYGILARMNHMKNEDRVISNFDEEDQGMSNVTKRRVNAISAQCIASQCGRRRGTLRKVCIMQYCNRWVLSIFSNKNYSTSSCHIHNWWSKILMIVWTLMWSHCKGLKSVGINHCRLIWFVDCVCYSKFCLLKKIIWDKKWCQYGFISCWANICACHGGRISNRAVRGHIQFNYLQGKVFSNCLFA